MEQHVSTSQVPCRQLKGSSEGDFKVKPLGQHVRLDSVVVVVVEVLVAN